MPAERTSPIRLLVVDDHSLFRRGLVALLAQDRRLSVVGEAGDASAALISAQKLQPDLILLDNHLPGVLGIAAIAGLHPDFRLIKEFHDRSAGQHGPKNKTRAPRDPRSLKDTLKGGLFRSLRHRLHGYVNAVFTLAFEHHAAINRSMQAVLAASIDIRAGDHLGAALRHDDGPRIHGLPAKQLDAEALTRGIATIAR